MASGRRGECSAEHEKLFDEASSFRGGVGPSCFSPGASPLTSAGSRDGALPPPLFLEVAVATELSALLREAAVFVLLLLGASVAFTPFVGPIGCSLASPLASAGPRDGSLFPSVLLEAAKAFVRSVGPREGLCVLARAFSSSRVRPRAPGALPPCVGACRRSQACSLSSGRSLAEILALPGVSEAGVASVMLVALARALICLRARPGAIVSPPLCAGA